MDRMTEPSLQTTVRVQPSRRRKIVWMLVVSAILVVVLGGFYGFEKFRQKMIGEFFANNKPPPTTVAAVKAVQEAVPRHLEGIGTIVAVNQVMISPQVAGRVVKILFQSGNTVRAGDPLIQLDDATERADLANFQAQAKLAQVNLQRAMALAKEKYGPQSNVDQQQSNLDVARAGIARSQSLIDQKLIRAPFNGTLGIRLVDVGQYLNPGTPMVTLTDLDHLYADFTLPENTRASLKAGLPIEITGDALPNETFKAELATIEPRIDPLTRAIRIRAALTNPEQRLQPGMFVHARVVLPPAGEAIILPETAIDYTAYGESVFLIQENGKDKDGHPLYKAVQTFVDVSVRYDGKAAITKGLKAGDLVVDGGQIRVQNGAAVTPKDSDALNKPAVSPIE
jgi:membrane fusion protein, multidrug efflux system